MQYTISSPSFIDVVSLVEAKANLRITHDMQDAMIQGMINTAIIMAENYTGRSIHNRNVIATTSSFENNLVLRETPVLGGLVITYRDASDATQILSDSLYTIYENDDTETVLAYTNVDELPALYDRNDAVTITYMTGLAENIVPSPYKTYVLLMVTKLYENPGDTALKYASFANSILSAYKNHT